MFPFGCAATDATWMKFQGPASKPAALLASIGQGASLYFKTAELKPEFGEPLPAPLLASPGLLIWQTPIAEKQTASAHRPAFRSLDLVKSVIFSPRTLTGSN